jgi:hypothetical protein
MRFKNVFILIVAGLFSATNLFAQANQTRFEDKSFWKKLTQEVSLSYYVALMGPTITGPEMETYNIFLEGRGPMQTFHAMNLRWQFNSRWAVGTTLAGIHHINTDKRRNDNTLFDSRVYLATPGIDLGFARMFNTFSLELPTTQISRDNELKYGLVLSQAISFKLPPSRFSSGWLSQIIRYTYERKTLPPPFPGGFATDLQTTLVTTGPYLNYQLSSQWQIASLLSFDWDQRGSQQDTLRFNNNLEDRVRLALNYFFQTKPFTHVGFYTQATTKLRDDKTIIGLDFSLKF